MSLLEYYMDLEKEKLPLLNKEIAHSLCKLM